MGVTYRPAKPGYIYVLTELGFEQSRIRSKFKIGASGQYKKCVPEKWFNVGWVKEVKADVQE